MMDVTESTIALSVHNEGRVLLRSSLGIREWFLVMFIGFFGSIMIAVQQTGAVLVSLSESDKIDTLQDWVNMRLVT